MQRQHARRWWAAGLAVALAALAVGAGWWWATQRGREAVFAVPPGTAARLAAGEDVQVLPQLIRLRPNDTLIIRNDDTETIQVGPFLVAPGQRFVQRYYNRGVYDLVCSVHQGQRLRVQVE